MSPDTQPVTLDILIYNTEVYIEKYLLSVLKQTCYNSEILIGNEFGIDRSMHILEKVKNSHVRGYLIR